MVDRATRLRLRRKLRQSKRQVGDIGVQAEVHLEKHFFRRLIRLVDVRRFVLSWLILVVMLASGVIMQTRNLSHYYQDIVPASGGTYTEGILGAFTNANPLYATNAVDSSVSKLLFSALFKYNQKGQLVNGLAEKWVVDSRGQVYTVTLKKNLVWQDGHALTADDVLFTYQTIQNPDAKSPLYSSFQTIKVTKVDDRTVNFTLPNSLSSFPHSLTNGIVPKHLLGNIAVSQLRSANFNTTNPIGSGPFKWETIELKNQSSDEREEIVGLSANETYYGGKPKLDRFNIRAMRSENSLQQSFKSRELNGASGLESLSDELTGTKEVQTFGVPINGEVVVFFKTSGPILSDQKVRQALVRAVDIKQTVSRLGYPVIIANSPILKSQVGYDKNIVQLTTDVASANKLLDEAGWIMSGDGIRTKNGAKLSIQLDSQNSSDYSTITSALQKQWKNIGVEARVNLQQDTDLQLAISTHSYDALLFGISIGPDPDVFPYWHSSQADPRSANRLNLSEYKSKTADSALEAGRTRSDAVVRSIKYRSFLESWKNDAPALVLYQPRFLYVVHGSLNGFEPKLMNSPLDRYSNIENWTILERKTNK